MTVSMTRLRARIDELARIGATDAGGSCRLALTDEDRQGRDLICRWMSDLGMAVTIDAIGNVFGVWNVGQGLPVMTGSHIDTVRTGGIYDGNYGVLAGLEVIEACQLAGVSPNRPLAVAVFTDEEGARFAPDMLGSLVFVGGLGVEEALDTIGIDGARLGDELEKIGYAGMTPCPGIAPHAFVELHIEQGPLLEANRKRLGAVTGVQGISWQEVTIVGQSNHAGTTPMSLRKDPVAAGADLAGFVRDLAHRYGGNQVCTVGKFDVHPNLVNVVAARVTLTLDIRNTDEDLLKKAESEVARHMSEIENVYGVSITTRSLARFEPVQFDERIIDLIEGICSDIDANTIRMPSGAGHDAQMLARVCPTAMIFVPSKDGISHNPAEHTDNEDLENGANALLRTMLALTDHEFKERR
ncbi:MAG: Zn-dependent hydrolase [Actinobacteria bacterium]|nr:Zn-dependent hydrolase [Actinomycetota bacterium]